eukprot:SAG31_NODE_42927_length_269_cov_0.905882_1_plen_23_part_01
MFFKKCILSSGAHDETAKLYVRS